jgi:hypothetical protein
VLKKPGFNRGLGLPALWGDYPSQTDINFALACENAQEVEHLAKCLSKGGNLWRSLF